MNFDGNSVLFSSFLAGVLLIRSEIGYGEVSWLLNDFSNKLNVYVDDEKEDNSVINNFALFTDKYICLKNNYDEFVSFNNHYIKVNDYLYGLTTGDVRSYFGIPDKKKSIFPRIKIKTKVS